MLGVCTSQDTIHFFLSDILYLKFILNVSIILESNASMPLDCPLILIGYVIFEGHQLNRWHLFSSLEMDHQICCPIWMCSFSKPFFGGVFLLQNTVLATLFVFYLKNSYLIKKKCISIKAIDAKTLKTSLHYWKIAL